jgi:hypothetical protein
MSMSWLDSATGGAFMTKTDSEDKYMLESTFQNNS